MGTNQYDDSDRGGYTYEEKLQMVSDGLMNPTEIGLPPEDEGRAEAQAQIPPTPIIGEFMRFECAEVPIGVRAHWARQELKIQPANPRGFEADWIEEHAKEHLIRGRLITGNQEMRLQQTVTEPVEGMIFLMREAANLIEKKYAELQATTEVPQPTEEPAKTDE